MKHFKTTDEKAIGFWTIVTNILLVLFTFWLGIVVQSIVAQKNATVSSTLANIEYVEKVKPLVDSLNIEYGPMLMEFSSFATGKDKNGKPTFTNSDEKKVLKHYDMHSETYADFFNDLAYTFAQIYKFDHNCDPTIRITASCLPILSPLIKSTSYAQVNGENNRTILKDTIEKIFRSPTYIRSFGYMIGNLDETMNVILQLYDEAIKTNDSKHMLIMVSEMYALNVYQWISNHSYYTSPKDTSLIGRIADNPLRSMIVLIVFGLVITWIVYRLHKWSLPSPKERDIHLKKTANNLEEIRKDTSNYRKEMELFLSDIKDEIGDVQDKISVLATPIYEKLYEQELEYVHNLMKVIHETKMENEIPKYKNDRTLFGERKYNTLAEYTKVLEEFMKQKGLSPSSNC